MRRRSSLHFRPRTSHSSASPSTFSSDADAISPLPSSSSVHDFPASLPERPRTNSTPLTSVFEDHNLPWADSPDGRPSRRHRLADLTQSVCNMARRASKSVHGHRRDKSHHTIGDTHHAPSAASASQAGPSTATSPLASHYPQSIQSWKTHTSRPQSVYESGDQSRSLKLRGTAEHIQEAVRRHFNRRAAISCPPGKNAASQDTDLKVLVPPGTVDGSFMHRNLRAGSAARASAAAHNADRMGLTRLVGTKSRDSPIPRGEIVHDDSDSAVFAQADIEEEPVPLKDIVGHLPTEISEMVLGYLSRSDLKTCLLVSHRWNQIANSPYVWASAFKHKYYPVHYSSPTPIQMGGAGVGNGRPNQDWSTMYKARTQLEHRWKKGVQGPAAIYFSGHTDSVYCCQFDEKKIITGSRDRTIRVWDIETYACLKVIGGPASKPTGPVQSVMELTTHPTATISALPSLNGTPEGDAIWHVPKDYHEASILCLMYDDTILVTGSSDSTCIVWDIRDLKFEPIMRLKKHHAGVLDVCFDAQHIISCSKDATICVWDRLTGNLIRRLSGHRGPVNAVQLRGPRLVSASGDGTAKLWDLNDGKVLRDFQSRDRGLAAVEFSDDGEYVLAGGNDMVVYKYDAHSTKMQQTYKGHTDLVRSLFLDTANGHVLSGSYDQSMRLYDYESGEEIAVFEDWTTSWILSAKCDYRRIVATSQDSRALMLDFGAGVPNIDLLKS